MAISVEKLCKIATALSKTEMTAKQISARFSVANPYDAVYSLRQEGFPVYLNNRQDSKGRATRKYRMGTPSRKVVAAGYKALAGPGPI